jgi:hypothetical protein
MLRKYLDNVLEIIQKFFRGYGRIFHASKLTTVFVLLFFGFLGLAPVFELHILKEFVDALIGARGIGVWTSDLTKFSWRQVVLLILMIPTWVFVSRTSGFVRAIGLRTSEILFLLSLGYMLLMLASIVLPIALIAFVFVASVKNRFLDFGFSVAILLFVFNQLARIINISLHSGATVGETIFFAGGLLVLGSWLAFRPFLTVK